MTYEYIPKLIRAAINNDRKNVESLALVIGKKMKREDPVTAAEIMKIVSCTDTGTDVIRSIDISPLPVDHETRYQLVKLEEPVKIEPPILSEGVMELLNEFVQEREMLEKFLEEEIVPPNSLLMSGKPGVGKTYIAKWLAYRLNMPMVTLDLANSISSYLGRSGQNIKHIFQYVKEQKVILFLDEMDAIAKRRDDASDLGELKRLVNVLLKELEECPVTCIIIGATNHPELLDKAIWRRFDRNINIEMPGREQRLELLKRHLSNKLTYITEDVLAMVANGTEELSAADVCKMCEHIKRRVLLNPEENVDTCVLKEFCAVVRVKTKEDKVILCKTLKQCSRTLTIKKISEITQIPVSTVDRYLKE